MKIIQMLASPYDFGGGCWFYRFQMPGESLMKRGHEIKQLVMSSKINKEFMEFPDVVMFRGTYGVDPTHLIKELKKGDTKIVYDVDDDYLVLNPGNPFKKESKKVREQYIYLCKEADLITVTTDILKKRLQKYNKNVKVIPNALSFQRFKDRKRGNKKLRIGYTGAASHWEDISLIIEPIKALQEKYGFDFFLQGMCGTPLIGEIYNYEYIEKNNLEPEKRDYYMSAIKMYEKFREIKYIHFPFYPPVLYPGILSNMNLDIGICPLKDNEFNQAKSSIKFYEYASTGTPTLASKVLPYSKEVGYFAKNNVKDWYNKLEKLIVDEKFRDKLLDKQQDFVRKNADMEKVVKVWEKSFQEL